GCLSTTRHRAFPRQYRRADAKGVQASATAGKPRRIQDQRRARDASQIIRMRLHRQKNQMPGRIEFACGERGLDARAEYTHQWRITREKPDSRAGFSGDARERSVV